MRTADYGCFAWVAFLINPVPSVDHGILTRSELTWGAAWHPKFVH